MPKSQLDQVLNSELGPDWSSKLISFDYEPLAAASIGQVCKFVMHVLKIMKVGRGAIGLNLIPCEIITLHYILKSFF